MCMVSREDINTMTVECKVRRPRENGKGCLGLISTEGAGLCTLRDGIFICPEALKRKLPPVTHSSVISFIKCRMSYYLHYIKGYRSYPRHLPRPMAYGSIWDAFVEAQYNSTRLLPIYDIPWTHPITFEPIEFKDLCILYNFEEADIAKLRAIMNAWITMEFNLDRDCTTQYKVSYPHAYYQGRATVTGYMDRYCHDHFVETKLSQVPDRYFMIENISHQVATYFLHDPNLSYVIMEPNRFPGQRYKTRGRFENETPEDFEARIISDILSRPSHYFQGYNHETRTYGKKFYRSEFDLDAISSSYTGVIHDLRECLDDPQPWRWYRNEFACDGCMYLDIKRSGVVSDEIYYTENPATYEGR